MNFIDKIIWFFSIYLKGFLYTSSVICSSMHCSYFQVCCQAIWNKQEGILEKSFIKVIKRGETKKNFYNKWFKSRKVSQVLKYYLSGFVHKWTPSHYIWTIAKSTIKWVDFGVFLDLYKCLVYLPLFSYLDYIA